MTGVNVAVGDGFYRASVSYLEAILLQLTENICGTCRSEVPRGIT